MESFFGISGNLSWVLFTNMASKQEMAIHQKSVYFFKLNVMINFKDHINVLSTKKYRLTDMTQLYANNIVVCHNMCLLLILIIQLYFLRTFCIMKIQLQFFQTIYSSYSNTNSSAYAINMFIQCMK